MIKTIKTIITLFIITTFLSGCTPIFIKEDTPVIISNNASKEKIKQTGEAVIIEDINNYVTDGIIYDISKDGNELLVSNFTNSSLSGSYETSEQYLNLNIYNIESEQSVPIIPFTLKNHINAYFDHINNGVYYIEDSISKENSSKILWTDLEGDITRNISKPSEIISNSFSTTKNNKIIFANNEGEISIANKDSLTNAYILQEPLNILKIDYMKNNNLAFFLVENPDNNYKDLYYALLNEAYIDDPILLDTKVLDFDVSSEKEAILYNKIGEKNNELYLLDVSTKIKTMIHEGYVELFSFSRLGDKIVYSEKMDSTSNSENLWIMGYDGLEKKQLASNLKLVDNSRIIFHPSKSCIYFSVYEISEEEDLETIKYKVYMIDYLY